MSAQLALLGGPDDPPGWCFRPNGNGDLPTCSYVDGQWHRSYDTGSGSIDSGMGGFAVLFVVVLLAGIGLTVWKVSTARRMARASGMDEDDATAMTLLTDDGLEATYLAANLRPTAPPAAGSAPETRSVADRLRELQTLLDQGLVTQAEYDERRRALIEGL